MTLTTGPEFKNDAHHVVLWTKQEFEGDLKIEYDYTRTDEAPNCVTILYIEATGSGEEPYAKDISKWNELRKVPAMTTYFRNKNLPIITEGRIGLRHMFTRSARHANFRVSKPAAKPVKTPASTQSENAVIKFDRIGFTDGTRFVGLTDKALES